MQIKEHEMIVAASKVKQFIHAAIPFFISFFLYSKGFSGFQSVTAGYLYIFFTGYIYFFVKKEEPGIWIMATLLYAMLTSGWGDF